MEETMGGDDDFKPEPMSEGEVSSEDEDKLGIRNFDGGCFVSTVLKEKEKYNGHFRRAGRCVGKCEDFGPIAIILFFIGGLAYLCHHLASDKDALQNPYT